MAYNGVTVKHVVATDLNGCIGKAGQMPWHVPADLKRFRELTEGGVVIMGRKTFESLGCKPLPNRMNIVIGSTMSFDDYYRDNKELLYSESINDALMTAKYYAKQKQLDAIWIIGGAEIYTQTMQYVDIVEHTLINIDVQDGDVFYPMRPKDIRPIEVSKFFVENDVEYRYATFARFTQHK